MKQKTECFFCISLAPQRISDVSSSDPRNKKNISDHPKKHRRNRPKPAPRLEETKNTSPMTAPPPFTGNKSQLSLAGTLFNSPTALSAHIRQLLWSQPVRAPFTGQEDALLREWVTYHPDAAQKVGTGITAFYVDEHRDYGALSRGIYIRRTDSSVIDISYKEPSKALVQLHKTGTLARPARHVVDDFKNALRLIVDPQCLAVKRKVFRNDSTLACPVTGQPFTFDSAHTDHLYPMTFDAIAWHWCLIWDIRPAEVALVDQGTSFKVKDQQLADAFAGFHLETANLRVISKTANITAPRYPTNWNILL